MPLNSPLMFELPSPSPLGSQVRERLNCEEGKLIIKSFPDGETYLRVLSSVEGRDVIIIASLFKPNEWILTLLFLADALRAQHAKRITLIAPYLSYMRQDKVFQPGEALTSQTFARLLSSLFDALLTVDPHLHRYHTLSEIYTIPTCVLRAAPIISTWIHTHVKDPFIIGPDVESAQWVNEIAGKTPNIVLSKVRNSDGHIHITWPPVKGLEGKTPVLVDDIISSGDTMVQTIQHLKEIGAPPPICIAIHPLFAENSYQNMLAAGAQQVITCNTLPHPSNGIDLTSIIVEGYQHFRNL